LVFFISHPPSTTIRQETLTLMDLVSKRLKTPGKGRIDGNSGRGFFADSAAAKSAARAAADP
jgi:hypothetical protein